MTDESMRDLLFGAKSGKVPLRTIASYRERNLIPAFIDSDSAKKWRSTFVGNFLYHNPRYHGIIMDVKEAIGKLPAMDDFTEANLNKIVEKLQQKAPNTARQAASLIKSTITRLLESDDCNIPVPCKRYQKILSLEGCPTTKTYMGVEDLKKYFHYEPQNERERICHARYAVMMMTGARYSDVRKFTRANIQNGVLTYVPQKTKKHRTVVSLPVSDALVHYIDILSQNESMYDLPKFNETIRDICRKCGLDEEVTYFWGGKYITRPKWQAIRSHLGRASFVTNMLKMGLQIHEVSKMAGHTDVTMTSRYNASSEVKLTKEANDFINMRF